MSWVRGCYAPSALNTSYTMNAGQNTVQPDFVAAMHEHLDAIEAECQGAGAIVLILGWQLWRQRLTARAAAGE